MNTALDHLPAHKREQLAAIAALVQESAPVEMIILFGKQTKPAMSRPRPCSLHAYVVLGRWEWSRCGRALCNGRHRATELTLAPAMWPYRPMILRWLSHRARNLTTYGCCDDHKRVTYNGLVTALGI